MIWEQLCKDFEFIVAWDTEFKGDMLDHGELNEPVCSVFKELKTGTITKHFGKTLDALPYPSDKTLYIAHHVGAEAHTCLSYGLKLPKYWWDTLEEDKKINFGKVKSHSLLNCCKRYGIKTISEELKKHFIHELILPNDDYTEDQRSKILDYCTSDVIANEELFYKQLKEHEEIKRYEAPKTIISQALFAGAAKAATAKVEFDGIPVNTELLATIQDNFPAIKETMIAELNAEIDVFENGVMKYTKFFEMVKRNDLLSVWPVTATGKLKTDEKTIFQYAQNCSDINKYYLANEFLSSQKLKGYIIGPDGRARTPYRMYGLKTGRTNPSTSRHPFNAPKCMRNLVRADPDKVCVNFDYRSQEIFIAAYLSGDPKLIAAVEAGDPYVYTAKLVKAMPENGTKALYPEIRDNYKTTLLACLYRQGPTNMSKRMNINIDYGTDYQVKIKNCFSDYFPWIKKLVDKTLIKGFCSTKFGFRYWTNPGQEYNPRTFYNFPIQSHGSEMLRLALVQLVAAGIEVNALIHDGIIVHLDRKKFRKQFIKTKKILENASRKILNESKATDYFCPVDFQVFRYAMIQDHMKDRKPEQQKWDRILNIIEKSTLGNIPRVSKTNPRSLSAMTVGGTP
tara:strand:+ start:874 stop:2742 length:1869 start_codon:yes stop_codon:yes gene_type:complete